MAEQLGSHFDEFEKAFQQGRGNLHKSKDLIMKRAEIYKTKGAHDFKVVSKCRSEIIITFERFKDWDRKKCTSLSRRSANTQSSSS